MDAVTKSLIETIGNAGYDIQMGADKGKVIHGTQYIDELVMVCVKDKGDLADRSTQTN